MKQSVQCARSLSHCSSNHCHKMAFCMLCIIMFLQCVNSQEQYKNEGIFNSLHSGMKIAQNLLGSESIAMNVAEFIVRAFQPAKSKPTTNRRHPNQNYLDSSESDHENKPYSDINEGQNPIGGLKYIARLFGLQPNQISAVAVNALVFVAQMITTFLAGPKKPTRQYRFEDTSSWILNKNSRALQHILTTAKNESLSDMIENLIKEQGANEDTSCIQLLVCKITPFVTKMQNTVFGNETLSSTAGKDLRGAAIMYRHLPTKREINDRSDICEQKHRDCNLNE